MSAGEPDRPEDAGPPARRLTGVDAARGVALVGMMAVHVLPDEHGDGSLSLAHQLFSGRASALFAVLAGVGLALATGGPVPPRGIALRSARWSIAGRAVVIAAIGLSLGSLGATVAVILAYYGVLFLTALPVLTWPARRLAVLAATCAVVTPVASRLLRTVIEGGAGENVQWSDLVDPGYLLGSVLLFGYYPVLTWTTYLFAGLAVGRCDLRRPRAAGYLVVTGGILAATALGVERLAVSLGGGTERLANRLATTPEELSHDLATSLYGTTPAGSWWWLLLAGRHSGSGPDLVHTTGTALVVLGCCLLLLPRLGRARVMVAPLVAAGSMTLTLYTLHVLALAGAGSGGRPGQLPGLVVLALHVVSAAGLALMAGSPANRGPLESLAAWTAGAAGRAASLSRRGRREAAGDGPPSGATPPG